MDQFHFDSNFNDIDVFTLLLIYHIIYISIRLSSNSTCLSDHGALFSENIYSAKPHTFNMSDHSSYFCLEIIQILECLSHKKNMLDGENRSLSLQNRNYRKSCPNIDAYKNVLT